MHQHILLLVFLVNYSQETGLGKCGTNNNCDLAGFDYNGNDITNFLIDSAAACACSCQTYGDECKAWSYKVMGSGNGRCFLKTKTIRPIRSSDWMSGSKECKCVTDALQCLEPGVKYTSGRVLKTDFFSTAIGCSCACSREKGCVVWTFDKNGKKNAAGQRKCTLMSRAFFREENTASESAVVNCQTFLHGSFGHF